MFSITVRSEKEDKRIPIAVASDVMFDIQLLLNHIGESLIAEEFGSHDRPSGVLTERFTLFIDPDSGGISFKTSTGKGKSALMDKASSLLALTLDKMGSGSGPYWMEDNFKDPRYRCMVLNDLIHLSKHMGLERGYTLMFSSGGEEKKFVPLDLEKFSAYLKKDARAAERVVGGILTAVNTKRNVPIYGFTAGGDRAKISFLSKDIENDASGLAGSAVVLKGIARYSEDGGLSEVHDVSAVRALEKIAFNHMISADRDVPLVVGIEAAVRYDVGTSMWKLGYPDLGISSSDKDWDTAVAGFHDYFVFLCDNYLSYGGKELSDEETEVRDILRKLTGEAE
ncbi:MAG: hypothetical protein FWD81_00720 [Methanomassiliicoccaceae archaeon]|nr:hypothetical protein [Methanomassiliicoccaceae archaeon]